MLAVNCFALKWSVWVCTPADAMNILCSAWTDGDSSLSRMKQKLDERDIVKFSHTVNIKGYSLIRDGDTGAFETGCKKLAAYDLVSREIESTKITPANSLSIAFQCYAIGRVIINARVVVDPVMIDRDKPSEYSFINDLYNGEPIANMMLLILQQHLRRLKHFHGDNGMMMIDI